MYFTTTYSASFFSYLCYVDWRACIRTYEGKSSRLPGSLTKKEKPWFFITVHQLREKNKNGEKISTEVSVLALIVNHCK